MYATVNPGSVKLHLLDIKTIAAQLKQALLPRVNIIYNRDTVTSLFPEENYSRGV